MLSWKKLITPPGKSPKDIKEWLGLITDTIKGIKGSENWYDDVTLLTSDSIVDDLETGGVDKMLSSEQGKILNKKVNDLSSQLDNIIPSIELSILVFGGNGDGIFDNSEAFRIALNSLRENGGGTLLVPKGKFIVNENIEIEGQKICLKLRSGAEIIRPQSSSNKKSLIHMWGFIIQ